jgi:glucosamine 6-phosphate synthetase-like amidotransferase/phosphosugar isomerase protein
MCGIAGYSLAPDSEINRILVAQALLAEIAERGGDAVGFAYRRGAEPAVIHKQRSGASGLLAELSLPPDGRQLLLHVRDFTKGTPAIEDNNHPVRHGSVVGIHNGTISNDDELMRELGLPRATPRISVDSEAIFALAESTRSRPTALELLRGTMATAWLDDREPERVYLARGAGRPLWIGHGRRELLFASTREALELAERYGRIELRKEELAEGSWLALRDGKVEQRAAFTPDRSFEDHTLPPVRAPQERISCLRLLEAIAAAL